MTWTGTNLPSKFYKLNVRLQANVLQYVICTYIVFVQFNLQNVSKYRDGTNDDTDDNHEENDDDNDEQEEGQRISENSCCYISSQNTSLLTAHNFSLHCLTVNCLFRLPHIMLKYFTEIPLHVISLVKRNSSCRRAQNLSFCSWISTSKWNKTQIHMTENTKHVGIFQRLPHTNLQACVSLLHCLKMGVLPTCVYIKR
jgi:hypothetical protein